MKTTKRSINAAHHADGRLSDEALNAVSGGGEASDKAAEILIEHGDELTLKETIACLWVLVTGFKDDGQPMEPGVYY